MKKIILGLVALTSLSTFASSYRCQVQGYEDYAVEINLNSNKAAFFDNNDWSVVKLSKPSVTMPVFSGVDNYGDKLTITFSLLETAPSFGTVSFKEANKVQKRDLKACTYVEESQLFSEI